MKKITFIVGLITMSTLTFAQKGLEKIIVEKYYVSNTADSIGSIGSLPVGSVTYRVYADMLPGYRFQALYGNPDHTLIINSTKPFFNNEDRGAKTANDIISTQLKNNTVALDSWVSVGASAKGQFGVLKSEDDGKANLLTLNSLLKNSVAAMGIPLTSQDGNVVGSPETVTLVGFSNELDIFDATSLQGNSLSVNNAAISSLNGATGPTAENRVLLGQFTTNGIFTFEFNIQIGTPTPGVSEKYVARNPQAGEYSIPSLILTSNNPPIVAITSPTNGSTLKSNTKTTITADATDSDGTVKKVEFFIDNFSVGIDSTAPYTYDYTTVNGNHTIYAVATDNQGALTNSEIVQLNVTDNIAPTITINVPLVAHINELVTIDANANDSDGNIAKVEFFIDSVLVGIDSISPFSYKWTALSGKHTIFAIAKDNLGATTKSDTKTINVVSNILPTISIDSPTNNNEKFVTGQLVTILASANDADGTIKKVEFFIDGKSIAIDSITPYSADYTAVLGNHIITAVATDNVGGVTTSNNVAFTVDDNQLPLVSIVNYITTFNKSDIVTINADAFDTDGKITQVEFFIDSVSIGVDQTYPYSQDWVAIPGIHIVKAVATDNNQAKTTSKLVSFSVSQYTAGIEQLNSKEISIYPNPAKNEVTISLDQEKYKYLQIYDCLGKMIYEKSVNTEIIKIDLASFERGIYTIQINDENSKSISKLIIE